MSCAHCSEGEGDAGGADEEEDSEEDAFRPASGNVAFGSAADGWAFTLDQVRYSCSDAMHLHSTAACTPAFAAPCICIGAKHLHYTTACTHAFAA